MPLIQKDSKGNYVDTIYTQAELDEAVKAENEGCALECEGLQEHYVYTEAPNECADAIRARNK